MAESVGREDHKKDPEHLSILWRKVPDAGKRSLGLVLFFKCCFTYTETIRHIRDGEPGTATSTFTQLQSSDWG